MSRKLVVNLLVYAELVKEGAKQAELLPRVATAQAQAAEVRREWISNLPEELPVLAQGAKENGLELFYSIPLPLFAAGRLDETLLRNVYAEARQMGATRVKFAVGDFAVADKVELQKLTVLAKENEDILLTVEGDQSEANGRLEVLLGLLEACRDCSAPVYATYDVGNFVWVGQEPLYNAVKLAPFVRYIHLKDVAMTLTGPQVRELDAGSIDWRSALELLPQDVPVALEFPCAAPVDERVAAMLKKVKILS